MVTAAVDTAVTNQLADEQTNVMQLEEQLTAHVEAAIGVTSCAMELLSPTSGCNGDADRAKMTEEAKQVLQATHREPEGSGGSELAHRMGEAV